MASSAACESGAEEQVVDHVVLQSPIHRPSHGLHAGPDTQKNKSATVLTSTILSIDLPIDYMA